LNEKEGNKEKAEQTVGAKKKKRKRKKTKWAIQKKKRIDDRRSSRGLAFASRFDRASLL